MIPGLWRLAEEHSIAGWLWQAMMASGHAVPMPLPGALAQAGVIDARADGPSGPNAAGIHDALLGGRCHRAADLTVAGELLRLVPGAVTAAYQNREFVRRAVEFLTCQAGMRQFLVIGMGLPAQRHVHDVAHRIAPGARVIYVDNDRFVLSHPRELLADQPLAAVIGHDLRDPAGIARHPELTALIDMDQPVAVLMTSVLPFIDDDDCPHDIVRAITEALAPGSYLVLSHVTGDYVAADVTRRVRELYRGAGTPFVPRTYAQVRNFLAGLRVVPPGLVNGPAWRAGYAAAEPRRAIFYAGVGRK